MQTYRCPMCSKTMDRNLALFLDHTQQHIIDRIKQEHPEWVEKSGVCKPCAEYYEKQLSGQANLENIGPAERQKRVIVGVIASAVALFLIVTFSAQDTPHFFRVLVFLPLFIAALGFFQAGQKTCALFAERGMQNLGTGYAKVEDPKLATRLRLQGRSILVKSAAVAIAATALFLFFF